MIALEGQMVEVVLFWCILLTSMVGSLCFGIWRAVSRRLGDQGNAVHIYRWLKAVIVLWILPIIFMAICLYMSQPNKEGALEDLSFRHTFLKSRLVAAIPVFLWALVAVVQMGRYLILWIQHRRSLQGLPRIMDPAWQKAAEEIARELKIRRRVDLREVPGLRSPMLVGLTRPVILLDRSVGEPEARRIILYHELFHYKQKDLWWQVWMSLMVCLNWFNPLCYKLHRELREWSEAACDSLTCRQGAAEFSPKEYMYRVIVYCGPGRGTRNYFTRAINETGSVQGFKDRVDRLFATMDTWEAGGRRYWAVPALYMILAILLGASAVYGATALRNFLSLKMTSVVNGGTAESAEYFTLKPAETENRPATEGASLFPNEEGSFSVSMEEGLGLCRFIPKEGMAALDLGIYGDEGIPYEFGIFTEGGELLRGSFSSIGRIVIELEEGKTYYIYVRDPSRTTEEIEYLFFWYDEAQLAEYRKKGR